MKKKAIFIFIIIILWILLIFYFSSRNPLYSSQQSSFVTKILRKIDQIIDFSDTTLFKKVEILIKKLWFKTQYVPAEMLVRKTAHFGLYFILGFISFFGFHLLIKNIFSILLAITFPNLIAVLDEYTQQYYNRGSSLNDVIIDLSGIIFGVAFAVIVYYTFKLIRKIFKKKGNSENLQN
ncbi:MAG TPA: hypothetical protein DER56_01435 [Thermosipho africanus]|nr:hypothetical protein [Thermosipho africanus]